MRGLKQTDLTSYWSLLNRTCSNENKQKIVKNVSLNCFLEHFRKLNTVQDVNEEEDDTFEHVDVNNVSNLNIELNSWITEKDVLDAVKCLKNNKACGGDLIFKLNGRSLNNLQKYIIDNQETLNIEDMWDKFKTTITALVKDHVPHKTAKSKDSHPWINNDIRKLIKRRDRL